MPFGSPAVQRTDPGSRRGRPRPPPPPPPASSTTAHSSSVWLGGCHVLCSPQAMQSERSEPARPSLPHPSTPAASGDLRIPSGTTRRHRLFCPRPARLPLPRPPCTPQLAARGRGWVLQTFLFTRGRQARSWGHVHRAALLRQRRPAAPQRVAHMRGWVGGWQGGQRQCGGRVVTEGTAQTNNGNRLCCLGARWGCALQAAPSGEVWKKEKKMCGAMATENRLLGEGRKQGAEGRHAGELRRAGG